MTSKNETAEVEANHEEGLTVVPNTNLVQALKKLNIDRIREEVEFCKKVFELELAHQDIFKKFDEKRRMIISGDYVPTEEECKFEYADPEEKVVPAETKGIPDFWPVLLTNLDMINEMIQEHDRDLIFHITDIRSVLLNDPRGYRLEFEFSENEYFNNKVLTKEYYFADSFDPNDPFSFDSLYVNRCKGCKIDWKSPEKDVTQVKVAKKMKHRNSNQVKTVWKVQKRDSFFNFFEGHEGTIEDAEEETKELMAADFDLGDTFRMNVLTRAVVYYTGEAIDDDYSDVDEMGDFAEEYDEDDDDDDDEDDDEDEEEEEDDDDDAVEDGKDAKQKSQTKSKNVKSQNGQLNQRPKRSNRSNHKSDKNDEQPAECKQQ